MADKKKTPDVAKVQNKDVPEAKTTAAVKKTTTVDARAEIDAAKAATLKAQAEADAANELLKSVEADAVKLRAERDAAKVEAALAKSEADAVKASLGSGAAMNAAVVDGEWRTVTNVRHGGKRIKPGMPIAPTAEELPELLAAGCIERV